MPPMRAPNGSNARCMARGLKPIVNCRANFAAFDWRIAGALMAGDQQQDARALAIARSRVWSIARPGAVEAHAVEVESGIRIDVSRASLRSQPPSSVPPRAAILGHLRHAIPSDRRIDGGFLSVFPVTCGSALSRDSGLIVAATRGHSAASSGLSGRTVDGTLGRRISASPNADMPPASATASAPHPRMCRSGSDP